MGSCVQKSQIKNDLSNTQSPQFSKNTSLNEDSVKKLQSLSSHSPSLISPHKAKLLMIKNKLKPIIKKMKSIDETDIQYQALQITAAYKNLNLGFGLQYCFNTLQESLQIIEKNPGLQQEQQNIKLIKELCSSYYKTCEDEQIQKNQYHE